MHLKKIKSIILIILLLTFNTGLQASNIHIFGSKKKEVKVKEKTEYEKLFSTNDKKKSGFITTHFDKKKLYFEMPLTLINREMLLGSTVTQTSDNENAIIGSKPTTPLYFRFEKSHNKICLSLISTDNIVDDNNKNLKSALQYSNRSAILKTFDIKAYNNDSTSVVFEVTDFFVGDNDLITPFDKNSANIKKGRTRTTSFKKELSNLVDCKTFNDNLSVKSSLAYTYSLTGGNYPTVKDKPFTVQMTRSILLLDSIPARPRLLDSRIAIFPTSKKLYSSNLQGTKDLYFANRWRVEPSDTTAYERGEKVVPTKQIVFYVDSCFPDSWKKSIFTAVKQWNEPFEKIGFKNVVVAKPFPNNNPEFDADNLKYSCIRYAPIAIENAMGPSWVDPRSGEILNASVYVYHDVIKILNQWLFIQTSQTNKAVRHKLIPNNIINDALRYVISHEIGHCLGFMHNMSASAVVPVDSLRSPSYTQKYGTTTSIMDYARFNYVAQPGDMEKGVALTPPRFGLYDYFLVDWNYSPVFNVKSSEEEYKITSGWITEHIKNPIYRYGKQQSEILDPRSQTEDLGDNAMMASKYGIDNLKYILNHLNEWLEKEDSDYSYRGEIYDGILSQYLKYLVHVYNNIGGIYLQERHVGDAGKSIESTPKKIQKDALYFFMNQLNSLDWINNESVLSKLPMVGNPADVFIKVMMKLLMSAPSKVEFSALKEEGEKYSVEECMEDIYKFIWNPTLKSRTLSNSEMKMQKYFLYNIASTAGVKVSYNKTTLYSQNDEDYINKLLACNNEHYGCCSVKQINPIAGFEEPMTEYFDPKKQDSMCYGYILKIRNLINKHKNDGNEATKLHYQLLLHQLNNALK